MKIYKARIAKGSKEFLHAINFMMDVPLTNKEIEVLAIILDYNKDYNALPADKRMAYIMSSSVRNTIKDRLDIKASNLSNILKALKTKSYNGVQILSQDQLNPHLDLKELPDSIMIELVEHDGQPEVDREDIEETQPEERASRSTLENLRTMGQEPHATGGQSGVDTELWEVHLLQGEGQKTEELPKG